MNQRLIKFACGAIVIVAVSQVADIVKDHVCPQHRVVEHCTIEKEYDLPEGTRASGASVTFTPLFGNYTTISGINTSTRIP